MTDKPDIIGIDPNAAHAIKALLADSDWDLASEKAEIVIQHLRRLPAIAQKYKRMEEALQQATSESCYCEWANCSHEAAKEALAFDPLSPSKE